MPGLGRNRELPILTRIYPYFSGGAPPVSAQRGPGTARFHQTTVSKLVEFLDGFEFGNVTDEAELESIVGRAKGVLSGVTARDLAGRVEIPDLDEALGALRSQVAALRVRIEEPIKRTEAGPVKTIPGI